MKKLLISSVLAVGMLAAHAASTTVTIPTGGFSNLLQVVGSAKVTQFVLSATTATNTSVSVIDTPTNSLTFVLPATTTTISYATNWSVIYTNYYGVVTTNSYTNVLYDATNTVVASTTNNYPVRISLATLGNTTATIDSVAGYTFSKGIWVTNTSSGAASVTINYYQ